MESAEPQIRCPKCRSTQLTANKKGFSGKNAVAGAILTGGIGLLAGTIGSNKVRITCLNCGHVFKPGEGAQPQEQTLPPVEKTELEQRVMNNIKLYGKLDAVKKYKDEFGLGLAEAKDAVDAIYDKFSGKVPGSESNPSTVGCAVLLVIAILIYFIVKT